MKIAFLFVLVLYIILCIHFSRHETRRHLTNEYEFGHFSRITDKNKFFFPQLLLAKHIKCEIGPGEAVWIPSGWWHWITSDPNTTALSYWCSNSTSFSVTEPFITQIAHKELLSEINDIISSTETIDVWNSKIDVIGPYTTRGDDKCITTIQGYSSKSNTAFSLDHSNQLLHSKLKKRAPLAFWNGMESDLDMNLWVTLGKHDTGLHYDDNNGLLHVLKGRKTIKLYPPSQSWLLAPLCVLPKWTKQHPRKVKYNINEYSEILDPNMNLPSARLLYESIKNKKVLLEISRMTENNNEYVWGCKWYNGIMRWELYTYLFKNSKPKTEYEIESYKDDALFGDKLCVVSTDLFDADPVVGPDRHKYWADQDLMLPFIGWGTQGSDDAHESYYILDRYARFKKNFKEYLRAIHITETDAFELDYECDEVCIFNKKKDEIFVMYLGIKLDDFINFLISNKYPGYFISHVIENYSKYVNIVHEIAIVYDIKSRRVVRTAFYGNV
jgi:hypothetical protein